MALRIIKTLRSLFNPAERGDSALYRKKMLAEYKNARPLYEEYTLAVHKLLDSFLREGEYRYQLTHRTKNLERLDEKLIRKLGKGISYDHLGEIEDLAGLRVIFYSDMDKSRFLKSIQKETSGIVRIEDRSVENGYEATHIILSFGKRRLKLSEYKHFGGLKCEIQATTILRHAWAEIQHDIVYKDILGLKDKDPKKFALVRGKLEDILEEHIKQASIQFEEVITQAL